MGNDRRTHPPLINIYMWMMRLNFASPVCAGASATRVAGHYFIWDLMRAEFIRDCWFPLDDRILFAAVGFSSAASLLRNMPYMSCVCGGTWESNGEKWTLFLVPRNETAGFWEYV